MENRATIGFIGLGAMGGGMARSLLRKGFSVRGFDVNADALARFAEAGGVAATSPRAAAEGAAIVVVMVATAEQADLVLEGPDGALAALGAGGVIMMMSTVPPAYVEGLHARVQSRGVDVLDAPVSGGVVAAEGGTLTVMASGSDEAFRAAEGALAAMAGKVYRLGRAPGPGSTMKMINQLLAGVHIAVSAEAMALAAKAGLDTRTAFEIISNSAGASWMFKNRVPHMLDADFTPHSALDIFVKDLGIVLDSAKKLRFPSPLAAAAHQLFLMGTAHGHGREDDAAVVKVFETLTGVTVAQPTRKGTREDENA